MRFSGKSYGRYIMPMSKSLILIAGLIVPGQYLQAQQAFPTASPGQVATALQDCLQSDGRPDELGQMNWHPEEIPSSPSGITKYVSRTNPVWMPVPDKPDGKTLCWLMATSAEGRSNYEKSIAKVVGTEPKRDVNSSAWSTKSHFLVMDWFSEQGITGMRIEVHRVAP